MPGAPSSFLFLVVRPGAPRSVLAPIKSLQNPQISSDQTEFCHSNNVRMALVFLKIRRHFFNMGCPVAISQKEILPSDQVCTRINDSLPASSSVCSLCSSLSGVGSAAPALEENMVACSGGSAKISSMHHSANTPAFYGCREATQCNTSVQNWTTIPAWHDEDFG